MAPPVALIIATAALSAVFFQALLTWAPDAYSNSSPGASTSKIGAADVAAAAEPPSFTLKTIAHGIPTTSALHVAATGKTSASTKLVLHESRPGAPVGWAKAGPAHASTKLHMRLGLTSNNVGKLKAQLDDISNPASTNYRKHLTAAQVTEYMKPDAAGVKAVNSWLTSHGIYAKTVRGHGDWITYSTTVGKASKMFNADFAEYHHADTGKKAVRATTYSLPAHLKPHIAVAHPMISFPDPHRQKPAMVHASRPTSRISRSRRDVDDTCSKIITPACLQEIYGIPASSPNSTGNAITVTGYIGEFVQEADLQLFLEKARPDVDSNTTFILQTTDGGQDVQDSSEAGDEANLDIQYTIGLAPAINVNFLSVGDQTQDGDLGGFLDTVHFVLEQDTLPTVMSTSYGLDEAAISAEMAYKLCDAYASLTAQGVSILFSTGDSGVGASRGDCTGQPFVPKFPVSCPYVTAVGATQGVPETGAALSSGGFSNYFPMPAYQADAVNFYVGAVPGLNTSLFNASGRAFPDVSAYGKSVAIVNATQETLVDGTSASTPIFASVIALINDHLLANGKPPLGFLNPWLYTSNALTDVTDGNNPGCGTDGFPATIGWDPVAGLGSPNFTALLSAAGVDAW